jgi:hypothetical protein
MSQTLEFFFCIGCSYFRILFLMIFTVDQAVDIFFYVFFTHYYFIRRGINSKVKCIFFVVLFFPTFARIRRYYSEN